MDSTTSPSTKPIYRGTQVVWYLLGVVQVLLAARFILKFLGANPEAGFTSFVYGASHPLTAPFAAVFGTSQVVEGSTVEWTTLLAMLVYWIIVMGIIKLFHMGKTVSTPEAAQKLDEQERQ